MTDTRHDLVRYQQLVETNLVPRQELDVQRTPINETLGAIRVDEASVANARLQPGWSRITAPVDGHAGLEQVDIGSRISGGDATGIVAIMQTHPTDLIFTLPKSDITTMLQAQRSGGQSRIETWDRTDSQKPGEGVLSGLNNQTDATTGTIKVKTRFNNQDGALSSNQLTSARMLIDIQRNAIMIPTTAL